jgi:hypothetical protein
MKMVQRPEALVDHPDISFKPKKTGLTIKN